jgi:hypothetical protein
MNFQTFSVSGGSKSKSLFDVSENPFDRESGTPNFGRIVALQLRPFGAEPVQSELQRNVKQPAEARPKQSGADVRAVIGSGI